MAWLVSWSMFAMLAILSITYGVLFGEDRFQALMQSWGIALSQTFAVEEPLMIVLAVLLPRLVEALSSSSVVQEILNTAIGQLIVSCVVGLRSLCQ